MRILALHPEDDCESGPWSGQKWARITDLGLGGEETYDRWRRKFHCEVVPLTSYRNGLAEITRVRDLLAKGRGRLVDQDGLDWWELTQFLLHPKLETLVLLGKLAETLRPDDELHISRPGFDADALRILLGKRVHTFARSDLRSRRLTHYLRLGARFPMWQLVQIFWDKYDPGYGIRGRFARKPRPSRAPVVLVPTAYVNVTRTALAYAKCTPDLHFLLVATRKSGWPSSLLQNAKASWLSSYASSGQGSRADDSEEILAAWKRLRPELEAVPEISLLGNLGLLEAFPAWIRQGIRQRDAWQAVLRDEPVQAVLCADDSNPSTRIPVLLANKLGLPTVVCHHGALDGRYMIKQNHADVVLAKGRMEADYLTRVCGVPAEEVEIGAPVGENLQAYPGTRDHSKILLFSELYEAFAGRPSAVYRDLLPPLVELAIGYGKKLVVKLHPAESEHERRNLIAGILSPEQRQCVTVATGPTTAELLRQAWFGITVLSTVATECAQLGIPCFLCRWVEFWPYGYIDQFIRFGAGHGLKSPSEIINIPRILEAHKTGPNVARDLWQPIAPGRLEQLLTARSTMPIAASQRTMGRVG